MVYIADANVPYGQDPSISASVLDNGNPGPTGTIKFSMAPAEVQPATSPLTALPVNAYDVTAVYSGDGTYAMATGVGNFAINNGSNRYDNY
jgi:hypothetical protein